VVHYTLGLNAYINAKTAQSHITPLASH
jgi:hypothetical protein